MSQTYEIQQLTKEQQTQLLELLWNYLKRDKEHVDRVHTGWGTKTKEGLLRCIARVVYEQ